MTFNIEGTVNMNLMKPLSQFFNPIFIIHLYNSNRSICRGK